MNQPLPKHPELLLGPNPLLEPLPPPIAFTDLPQALARNPFADIQVMAYPLAYRENLIESIDQFFVSTSAILEIAAGLQILIRRALAVRNPLIKTERVRINRLAVLDDENINGLKLMPAMDGAGMLVSGMTATGKSTIIKRMLELIVPDQVIMHGNSTACEWHRVTQCYYLYVDQSSNGTRGGLLKRILEALDAAVGTSHFAEYKRSTNLDSLLVVVCKLLSLHRVAVLIIDENQQSNLADSPWALEFVLFYHSLMNLGISVVLIGNPLAFAHLHMLSQVMRRFAVGGIHELVPALASDRWWKRDYIAGIRTCSLVEEWQVDDQWRDAFELTHSGGLTGLHKALFKEIQRSALRRGGERACVIQTDFTAALKSPRFLEVNRVAQAVNVAQSDDLIPYTDIPQIRRSKPPKNVSKESTTATPPTPLATETTASLTRMLRAFQAGQTKDLNKVKKRVEALQSLSPDDARMLGVSDELIRSMKEAIPGSDDPPPKRKAKGAVK
ncbi:MAG: TniB family NTP-binding protein [Burkholderiales bacterium]|nr:TniB family NTP-binding protein [Burkholderiales bacterium]